MVHNVGIIGAGGIARVHAQAIAQTGCAEIVAVCSASKESVDRYCSEFNIRNGYTCLSEMLGNENLDIAIICTWGRFHAAISNQIARSGKVRAILCEKPIAQTSAECVEMFKTAREHGVLLAEAFKFRHHPLHLKVRSIIDEKRIGELCNIRSTFCVGLPEDFRDPSKNWRFNRESGGGAVYDLGCYNIHHARFIAGAEPISVYARGEYGREVDESVCAILNFPNNVTAQLTFSFKMAPSQYFEISGTDGVIYAESAWNNENKSTTLEVRTRNGVETHEFEPVMQFQNQIEHLCECLDTGQTFRIPPENSIGNMRTIDAIYESMLQGQVVGLK